MKRYGIIFLLKLLLLPVSTAHHVRLPLEEWESKSGKEFTERYGTLNAGRRMAGYTDGVFSSSDLEALSVYLSSEIPFYEQRNVIYVLAEEIKKGEVFFSLEEEREAVGGIIKKLRESEAQPDGRLRVSLLRNGLKRMVGYYDPRLEQLSKDWSFHDNSYIREGALEYLQFVSENKSRSVRENAIRLLNDREEKVLSKPKGNLQQVSETSGSNWPLIVACLFFATSLGYLGYKKLTSEQA